jgi:hypothetical protein
MRLDGEVTALFASLWPPEPVFHAFDHYRPREDDGVSRDWTRCGLLVSSYDPNATSRAYRENLTWVPMRHALVFGRPCKRCFPDA